MIHLYSADRARSLVGKVAEVVTDPPSDPMTPEWLAVPSDGMRRWLTLELAGHLGAGGPGRGDGVVANVIRAYPSTLRTCVLSADRVDPDRDPWAIDRLVWSVLAATEARPFNSPGPLFPVGGSALGSSRYSRSRRLADMFDRYHLHRPGMVRSWAAGEDVDGVGRSLPKHALWQPELWRRIRSEVGEPSPPEQWPELLDRLTRGELTLDLPQRLVLFGFTLLPGGGFVDLLSAVAAHREVHLFLLEPVRYDADLLSRTTRRQPTRTLRLRSNDPTASIAKHPLVRSWGRLHREAVVLLADAESSGLPERQWVEAPELARSPTLLGDLQQSILSNAGPGEYVSYRPDDRSVQFHACFGPTRQVEVMRDALLHLLNDSGAHLSEEDILVVCPSIERFAPLIRAVLGPSAESNATVSAEVGPGSSDLRGSPALRYRIVDQSIGSTNPMLSSTLALLDLVSGRFEAAAVLDFLALGPVRQRFGFDDDDLDDIAGWVRGTNVRWGLDPAHRDHYGVPESIRNNTWSAALDRLMVGVAVHDEGLSLAVGEVVPYAVDGSRSEVVGRLAEIMWFLHGFVTDTRTAMPLRAWIERLREVCDQLFATDRSNGWQFEVLDRILADILQSATDDDEVSTILLEFVDLKRLISERFSQLPGRPDYFRGGITISSLAPLRWVPFRVICLLGMDQSSLGSISAAGDDLVVATPALGDPDPRADVRQSLLEIVLAAGDHLIVVRDGHDVRTNQPVPQSVVTAELFDAVVSSVEPDERPNLLETLEIDHPRQAFHERCFEENQLIPGVWGFDAGSLDGALARRRRRAERTPFLPSPLEDPAGMVIELDQLRRFFKNPTAYFVAQRLEARLPEEGEEIASILPVNLDPLSEWQVGTRLLEARMAGVDLEQWRMVERERGTLPPGALEGKLVERVSGNVEALLTAATELGMGDTTADPFEIAVELGDGTRIVGSVPLRLGGISRGPARVSCSKLKAEHRLGAWLDLMALVATDPSEWWRAAVVGKPPKQGRPADVLDLAITGEPETWATTALQALETAVECFRKGLTEPIPFFPSLSYDLYLKSGGSGPKVTDFVRHKDINKSVALVYGDMGWNELLAQPAKPGDPGSLDGRVARLAHHVYGTMEGSTRIWSPVPGDESSDPVRA
jgi:exodeoxyribonuclease V gamma subunit